MSVIELRQREVSVPAIVAAVNVEPPSVRQRVKNAFQAARICCSRECFVSCKERAIHVVRTCAPLFKLGVSGGLFILGVCNIAIGLGGISQGFLDQNTEILVIAAAAAAIGIIQLFVASEMMARNRDGSVNENTAQFLAAGVSGVGCVYPATKIAEYVIQQQSVQNLSKPMRIAIGILAQTGSGMVIAGVTTMALILVMRGAVRLYYVAQEARVRRDNPAAAEPLVASLV